MSHSQNRGPSRSAVPTKPTSSWLGLPPRALAAVFTLIVIAVMFALGAFIIFEYRSLQMQSHGRVGGAYIDNLLAPLALEHSENQSIRRPDSEQVFSDITTLHPNLVMRVWRLDGTLLYSSFTKDSPNDHETDELEIAVQGNFVVQLETSGAVQPDFPLAHPFFEVYAPIHDPVTGVLIAVGEIYLDATGLLRDRAFVERTIWAALILTTLGMLGMLALTFNQSFRLEDRLAIERKIAVQNVRLRRDAVRARLDAAQANEQVLNVFGAELHDGPIQLLSLVSLMQDQNPPSELPGGMTVRGLIDQVIMELRTMSAGLLLPELEDLDTATVVLLAVERHKALMAGEVEVEIAPHLAELDLPRKICLYRVLREGLSNAVRHSKDHIAQITIRQRASALDVVIHGGPSEVTKSAPAMTPWHLGLNGMRRRLDAFGGEIALDIEHTGSRLRITRPLQSPDEQSSA